MFTALIVAAIAGLIAYLAYRVTKAFLKAYRKKKQSKEVLANLGSLIKNIPDKEKRTMSIDDLDSVSDEIVIAEYDEETDELVQKNLVGNKGIDNSILNVMNAHDGILILE